MKHWVRHWRKRVGRSCVPVVALLPRVVAFPVRLRFWPPSTHASAARLEARHQATLLCSLPLPSQLRVPAVVPQPATRLGTPRSSHIPLPNCLLRLKTARANSTMPRASSRRCRFPCLRFRHLLRQHRHFAQHQQRVPSFFVALARPASQSVLRVPKIVYPVLRATTSRRQNRIILDLY